MAYAIFGDSYVEHLKKFTRGDMGFKYACRFYGVSGMATDHKFQAAFDQLCFDRPRYLIFMHCLHSDQSVQMCKLTRFFAKSDCVASDLGLHCLLDENSVETRKNENHQQFV